MTRKRVISAAILLCLVLVAYFAIFGVRTTRISTLRELVSQNLKSGVSADEVDRFLTDKRIDHSKLMKLEAMTMGGHQYNGQNIIWGAKRGTAKAILWREDIELIFVFSEDRKLVRYDVFPVYNSV